MASSGAGKAATAQASAQKEATEMATMVARELHEHWKTYYRDCDIAAIQEVCALPEVMPDYNFEGSIVYNDNTRNFARANAVVYNDDSAMCLQGQCQSCNYLSAIEALTFDDVGNFAYRVDEATAVVRNQARLEQVVTHLGLGRNLLDNAFNAQKLAQNINDQVSKMQSGAMQNWATFGGYMMSERGQKQLSDTYNIFSKAFGGGAKQPGSPEYEGQKPQDTPAWKATESWQPPTTISGSEGE